MTRFVSRDPEKNKGLFLQKQAVLPSHFWSTVLLENSRKRMMAVKHEKEEDGDGDHEHNMKE